MTYALFLYNIVICFADVCACAAYALLYRSEGKKTFRYVSVLFGLYVVDVLILYMFDFIPEFKDTLLWLQETAPYVYPSLSLGMLLCYRLILSTAFNRSKLHTELPVWIACFAGTVVSWAIPDFAISVTVEWVFATILRVWIAVFGIRMLATKAPGPDTWTRVFLGIMLGVFVLCEVGDTVITFQTMAVDEYPLRRPPMELLGFACTTAAFIYLMHRKRMHEKELEEGVVALVSRKYGLTRRERDIFDLMVSGLSNREIGEREYISVGTVKTHAHNIYRKLGIDGRNNLDDFLEEELRTRKTSAMHDGR